MSADEAPSRGLKHLIERIDIFDVLALGLIAIFLGLALARWSDFPVFHDIYYHMGITRGFGTAGGVALHSFWDFAPAGRPQLYPPLLHVIMYSMNRTGLSIETVGRLVSFSTFNLLALSLWFGMRTLFSSRAAFYTVVVLCSSTAFFLQTAVTSAASLVLIILPFLLIAVEKDRKVAAVILLALMLYSHLVLGHLIAFGLLIYAIHRRKMFKEISLVLVGAYVIWLPWGIHVLLNFKSLNFSSPSGGNTYFTVHILIWLIALAGFVYCYFKKGPYYLLPSLLLGMVPILFFYSDRFWDGHAFIPLAMLGGVALSGLHGFLKDYLARRVKRKRLSVTITGVVMLIPVALLLLIDPVYTRAGGRQSPQGYQSGGSYGPEDLYGDGPMPSAQYPQPGGEEPPGTDELQRGPEETDGNQSTGGMPPPREGGRGTPGSQEGPPEGTNTAPDRSPLMITPSTLISLIDKGRAQGGPLSLSDSDSLLNQETRTLAEMVEVASAPDQIFSANSDPLDSLLTGLTGRASTGGMLHEVESEEDTSGIENVKNAYLVVIPSGLHNGIPGEYGTEDIAVPGQPPADDGTEGVPQIPEELASLEYVGSSGQYSLYLNPETEAQREISGTVIPWFVVFPLLGLALGLAVADFIRPFRIKPLLERMRGQRGGEIRE